MGEVEVLKYALRHHEAAKKYHDLLTAAINKRRHTVFYEAFREGNLAVAGALLPLLENKPRTIRFRIKCAILALHRLFHRYDLENSLSMTSPSEPENVQERVNASRTAAQK